MFGLRVLVCGLWRLDVRLLHSTILNDDRPITQQFMLRPVPGIVPYVGMKIVLFDEGSQIEKKSLFDLNQQPLRKILSD